MCNNGDEFSFHYGGSKIICNVQNFATAIAEAIVHVPARLLLQWG